MPRLITGPIDFSRSLIIGATIAVFAFQVQTPAAQAQEAEAVTPRTELLRSDLAIDRSMGAFNDPAILRQRLQTPPEWPAPRTMPPYGQKPLNDGSNFCKLYPNNCG